MLLNSQKYVQKSVKLAAKNVKNMITTTARSVRKRASNVQKHVKPLLNTVSEMTEPGPLVRDPVLFNLSFHE